jgi:hypothetical protein
MGCITAARSQHNCHEETTSMTRRDLGKIALFQAAMANAQTAKKYTGALDGVESKVDANNFNPVWSEN